MNNISPILASLQGTKLSDDEKRLINKHNPFGFCFFKRNIESKDGLKKLIKEIRETMERDDIIFSIDQEGGRVRRLTEPEFRPYLPQSFLGKTYEENPELAKCLARTQSYLISEDFHDLGINMNLSPVLDVRMPKTSNALSSRCFSDNKEIVKTLGQVFIDEYNQNKIHACMKHIPGHGKAYTDPHLHLPIITQNLKELESDFYPFKQIKNINFAMTAHILISAIDDKLPVTQSKKTIDKIIRGEIGFKGILFSDAIDMKALKGSMSEKANTSLDAGCDCVCYAGGNIGELTQIFESIQKNDTFVSRFKELSTCISKENTRKISQKDIDEYEIYSSKTEAYIDEYDSTEVLNLMSKK